MPPIKIYSEHGALTREIRKISNQGWVELVHFPYDPKSRSRRIKPAATPSQARWDDMNVTWAEAGKFVWDDFKASSRLAEILSILGPQNRRDALHIDSAHKSGCPIFITRDGDILEKRDHLEKLLSIRFFHPDRG